MRNPYSLLAMLILGIIIFSFSVSAEQSLQPVKLNTCVELKQTCTNCTFVNITQLVLPNSTVGLGQVVMTKIGTNYNYTFCNNTLIGDYIYWTIGNPDGQLSDPTGVSYKVTKTGLIFEQSYTIPLIIPVIIILLTAGFVLFLAFQINFQNVKTLLIMFTTVLLLFAIIYSLNITTDILSGFNSVTGGFVVFYRIMLIIFTVFSLVTVFYTFIMIADKIKSMKGLK